MVLATMCPSPYRNRTPGSWSSSPPRIDASSPRSCTCFPVRPPMIKSTVSGGALVTSSPSGAKSTRQRGVKHSITKRFTRGARWEVRLTSPGPRVSPAAPLGIVEPQVAVVLARTGSKRRAMARSWPKIVLCGVGLRKERQVVCGSCPGRCGWEFTGNPVPPHPPATGLPPAAAPALTSVDTVSGEMRRVRPHGAAVRRAVLPVGAMPLRSGPCSGILLGTRGTHTVGKDCQACAGGLHGRTLERVGREVANWPKPAAAAARPARTVLSAARRVSAAFAENPHHGRS
jgi:hypothetical protein